MIKIYFLLIAFLTITSCDVLQNHDNESLSDSLSDSFPSKIDISISSIETTSSAKKGDVVTVDITVVNSGTTTVDNEFEILLNHHSEGSLIGKKIQTSSLAPNDSAKVSMQWDTENVAPGEHILVAKHTFNDERAANDSLKTTVIVSEADFIDIAVTEVRLPTTIEEGEVVVIDVDVKNIGNQDVNEAITIELHTKSNGKTVGVQKIEGGLAIGGSGTVSYSWDTRGYTVGDYQLSARHDFVDENEDNDIRTANITIKEAPVTDITVTSIEAPSEATEGDIVVLKADIVNTGNQDVKSVITVTLADQSDGSVIDSKSVSGGLTVGETRSVTFNWNTGGANPGNYMLAAKHNLEDDNPENDSKVIEVRIIEAQFLDIAITKVNAPEDVEIGDKVTIEVTIRNLGNRDITDDILVTLFNETEDKTIGSETVKEGLKTDDSITLKFDWNTKGRIRIKEGDHTFIVSHNFADDSLTNNSRTFIIEVEDD